MSEHKPKKSVWKRKRTWIITGIIFVIVIGVVIAVSGGSGVQYDTAAVERGDIIQQVSVTGNVQPVEGLTLAFERVGRVSRVPVSVNDDVYKGQILVELSVGDLYADLDEARARVQAEQAKLDELERGARPEDIAVKQTELAEAEQTLTNYYDSVLSMLSEAYYKADDAVRSKTSAVFTGSASSFYELTFNTCTAAAESDATFLRLESEGLLSLWNQDIALLQSSTSQTELDLALEKAVSYLTTFQRFLERTSDTLTAGCVSGDSTYDGYRTSVSTARSNVVTARSSVITLQQSIASQKTTVDRKEQELTLKLAGSSEEQIAAQEAAVAQADARVDSIIAQIEKARIRAPFAGTITKVDAQVGEIIEAYAPVVGIISNAGFEIETNIPEVDVTKVSLDNEAQVTLDAYGDDVIFTAIVSSIDTAETVIDGVSTYTTTLQFTEPDERIRPGMTANVDIITGTRESVLFIPQRAIIDRDNEKQVRVLRNGEVQFAPVVVGLRGEGNAEILEGLTEGEEVVVFINSSLE